MGNLTTEFLELTRTKNASLGHHEVDEVFDLIRNDQVKEASQRMAVMSSEEIILLNKKLASTTGLAQGTVAAPVVNPIAAGGSRDTREWSNPDTEVRPADQSTDFHLGIGSGSKTPNNQGGAVNSPDIGQMLVTPINETLRQPAGESGGEEIKKTAELFIENYKQGIREGLEKLASLVKEKGRLDMASEYGEPYVKLASKYGSAAATEVTLRAHTDGVREVMGALINNQEVKMGSLSKLIEDQNKVAGLTDLGSYARELGRMTVMNKVANLEAMEEEAAMGGEEEIPEEVVAELEALVEQAIEAPETLTDEQAEVILELADEAEDAEGEVLGGMENVSTVTDIVAALRHYGYR